MALDKKSKLDEELVDLSSNNVALQIHKEKQAKARNEAKQFWQ